MTSFEVLTLTLSLLSVIAAAAAAIYAARALERSAAANRTAEAAVRFQVLLPALTEYRAPQMYLAIRHLWQFFREEPASLASRFRAQREQDLREAATLSSEPMEAFIRTTIDFHRRQVSQFYGLLTSIHDEGGHQRKWLYIHWRKRELKIIPEILIPLERELAEIIGEPAPALSVERLTKLYEDSPT